MPTATILSLCCCLLATVGASTVTIDSRFGATLQEISARSPFKYVREAILAAEGETRAIACSFDSLYTAGKHWKRTFYSPVTWSSYSAGSKKSASASEEPITDGKILRLPGGKLFAYKLMNPMSAAPGSILLLENLPLQLTDTYFVCRTSLNPGSVQAFYLKVIKAVLYTPGVSGGRVQAKLGASLKFDCHTATNFPMTSVYWSRRRSDSKWSTRQPVLAWGTTYELARVTMETAGYQYTCHVNNHLDPEWTANFRIDLVNTTESKPGPVKATYNGVRPAFMTRSSQALPRYGASYTLSCQAEGDGIGFAWLRNGTELKPFADPNVYTYSSSLGRLHFADLILRQFRPGDRGRYDCLARNAGGQSWFAFNLNEAQSAPPPSSQRPPPPPSPPDPSSGGGAGEASQQQQQRLGSGWGSGDGDAEEDASPSPSTSSSGSGARQPPLTARSRVRRHWRRAAARRIPLPVGKLLAGGNVTLGE